MSVLFWLFRGLFKGCFEGAEENEREREAAKMRDERAKDKPKWCLDSIGLHQLQFKCCCVELESACVAYSRVF